MIPMMNIVAWGNVSPWSEPRQVEQDLIISRGIIALFTDDFLREELRFRGGTALNKLHFPAPLRYSEDIDLVRTRSGPIGAVLDHVRKALEPWLGHAAFDQSPVAPKLVFRAQAEDGAAAPLRLKVEINTREIEAYDEPQSIQYAVENPWFSGEAAIPTYSREEMLATKLRALLQRDKGRDLFDLAHALDVFEGLDTARVVDYFLRYLGHGGHAISRAEAEQRMFAKLSHGGVMADMRPLVAAVQVEALTGESVSAAFSRVFVDLVRRIPGAEWARTGEMIERFDLALAADG